MSVSQTRGVIRRSELTDKLPRAESLDVYKVCRAGDIVFNKMSIRAGALGVAAEDGLVTYHYEVMRPRPDNEARFIVYFMKSPPFIAELVARERGIGSGGQTNVRTTEVPFSVLKTIDAFIPTIEEQRAIADFLDHETAMIDALIAKQEQLIATLREDRTATITHAVTKGLDSDVEMNDSGAEWLGEIPSHWMASRLKNIIQSTESGTSVNAGDWPAEVDDVGVLKTSCVSAGWFNPAASKTVVDENEIERVTCPVRADSLIVNRANTPLLVGSAGYAETSYNNLFLSDKLWQVRFDDALAQFIYYWTQTEVYRSQIVACCVGASSSMQNLAMTDFRNVALALPPTEEQLAIVVFLSERTVKIDNLIAKSDEVIDALREYRIALIADAVTGKIDVRGAA